MQDTDFETIAESIPHIAWLATPDGSIQYISRLGAEYTGFQPQANDDWGWVSLVHSEDAERTQRVWEQATRTRSPFSVELRIGRFDGPFRWHRCEGWPVRRADGRVIKWIGTAIDIEDQKQLRQSLEQAQRETAETLKLLETLHSASPVGFGFVDRELRIVRLNEALASVNGAPLQRQLGRPVAEVVPELWSQLEPIYRRVLDTRTSVINLEVNGPAADDPATVHHWLASYYPVSLDDEIIGVGIVVVDVTERRHAEALRATVVDNMAEGLYTLDAEGCLTSLNASGAEILGWNEAELRGRSMHAVVHHQHADGSPIPRATASSSRFVPKVARSASATMHSPARTAPSSQSRTRPRRWSMDRQLKALWSCFVIPAKNEPPRTGSAVNSTRSPGSAESAKRSMTIDWSCTHSRSSRSETANPAKSSWSG